MPALPASLTLGVGDLTLRDWHQDDAPALEAVCGESDVCLFTSIPWTYTLEGARSWVQRLAELRASGTAIALAITTSSHDLPVGNVNLVRFSPDGQHAALGYWLVPDARGEGLATQAARLLCDWGFHWLGLRRVELAILPENSASQAVARRLGAVLEGLRHDSHTAGGRSWDMLIYSLTAHLDAGPSGWSGRSIP